MHPSKVIGFNRLAALVASFLLLVFLATTAFAADKNQDKLAKCLAAKKVTMYGDFRCPHCAQQKAMFGASFKYVPYVECGTPGKPMTAANQQQPCRDLQITKYPTWIFPNGERDASVLPLDKLAEKAGCKVE